MIILNKTPLAIEHFPNKESKIKDFESFINTDNLIEFTYEDDGDLIRLMFIKGRLDELGKKSNLWINYMPYSRMDRKIEGDLFTLQYVSNFINNLNFDKVYIVEPHSQVTLDLVKNSTPIYPVLDWLKALNKKLQFSENDRIIFPDKGAAARYRNSRIQNICTMEKTRNPQTGRIENMTLKEGNVLPGSKCIIIDDLCSAGGTFLWAAKILKDLGAQDIYLLVTHCEPRVFKGDLLKDNSPISMLFTSNSMMSTLHEKITYLPLNIEDYVQ